jgi:Na+/melibiose symporter-like transporter
LGKVSLAWILKYSSAKVGIGVHDMFFNAVVGLFLRDFYGLPNFAIGFLANERSFIGSVLQPIVGGISDRTRTTLGRRLPFMVLGIPVTVVCMVALAFYPPAWLAVLLILIGPIFISLAVLPYQALLPDSVVPEQRGSVNGVAVLLGMAGGVSLLIIARTFYGMSPAIVILAVATALAVGTLVTVLTVREPAVTDAPRGRFRIRPVAYARSILSLREATKYVACYFCFWFGLGGVTPFITRFGKEELGIAEGDTFILLLTVVITTLLFAAPAGRAGDRFGKKRVTSLGLIAFAVLFAVGSQVQRVEVMIPILALAGVAQAITSVLAYPLFTELVPARRMGELTGLSTMVWSLAQPLGATLLGLLADQTGTLRTVLAGAAVALLVSFVILQFVKVPEPAPVLEPVPVEAV